MEANCTPLPLDFDTIAATNKEKTMARFLIVLTAFVVLLTSTSFATDRSADEEKLWSLEQTYWRLVQSNDLGGYRQLWHAQFLGWPYVSPEPLGKDHITDWITAHIAKGESLKSFHLERLPMQILDNTATTTYRTSMVWVGKGGAEQASTIRVIHTWLRGSDGSWKIISGMSAPVNAQGH
jgi:ketosteroid isomerase-like protein